MCTSAGDGQFDLKQNSLKRLEESGGIDTINCELQRLFFAYKGFNGEMLLMGREDLMRYPALNSLGNSIRYISAKGDMPPYFKVRFGKHHQTAFFYLFHPDSSYNMLPGGNYIRISQNIYAR